MQDSKSVQPVCAWNRKNLELFYVKIVAEN
jgi:hypothetical protein